MRVSLVNAPWHLPERPGEWGVRAGSRWPHFQRLRPGETLPRYVPFPFFLAIAASLLKEAGHQVQLLDAVAEGVRRDETYDRVAAFKPELLFLESSTPSFDYDVGVLREFRRRLPGLVTVCAGAHSPKMAAAFMKRDDAIGYWIAGEYEESLRDLLAALSSASDPSGARGLIRRGGDFSSFAKVSDLDALPPPLFESLPMANYVDGFCGMPKPGFQSWLSRGCPFGCSFCVWPQLVYGERKHRPRSIDKALDEVENAVRLYGLKSFYFDDDTVNLGEARMAELCEKIVARGLDRVPWGIMARADCMSDAMLENFKRAGLFALKYGVESVSPKLLNACEKGTRLDALKRAIAKTKELGIRQHLTFTFGIPGETVESMRETLRFAKEIDPDSAQFSLCTPFPGTKFYDECVANGWLATDDWTRFIGSDEAVVSTPQLSAAALDAEFKAIRSEWLDFKSRGAAGAGGGR